MQFRMHDKIVKHSNLAAFLLGAVSVTAFAPWHYIICAFIGFSGLMWLTTKAVNAKKLFMLGYWFGFALFACGFSWIGNALLIEPEKFGWLYPIAFVGLGGFFGLFVAVPLWCTRFGVMWWQKWLIFAASFVFGEWLRSFVFTGFPWNLTGYTLAFSDELVQAASLGGSYLLSLLAILSYTIFGFCFGTKNIKRYFAASVFSALIFAGLYLYGYIRLKYTVSEETETLVRLVQPSIPQTMKWSEIVKEENFAKYIDLSGQNAEKVPDFIVWGETASPFLLDQDENQVKKLVPLLEKGSYLLAGAVSYHYNEGRYLPHNSMLVLNSEAKTVDYYHKSHLVPFGEYIPFRKYLPKFVQPVANAIGTFGKGDGPKVIKVGNLPSFGAIICYEAIFPAEVVDKNNRPDFLVNLTNDGWYGDSSGPYQHWVATKMRAVEEGISIVRVANNGISGVVDAVGRVKNMMPLNYVGFMDINIDKPLGYKTLYSVWKNKLILMFCLILSILGIIRVNRV